MTVKIYDIVKVQALITGNPVHGVGYRVFLLQKALGNGILKFNARNEMSNEKQQVIVQAEGEPAIIEEFCSILRRESPPDAIISDISFLEYTGYVIGIVDYMHLLQVEQLSKGIPAIISIDKKQDRMLEKQDQMLEKQDRMLETQGLMLEKQDVMIRTMDHMETSITGEINDLRTDLRSYLDRKLSVMEHDIQQIKTKIGLT